MENKEIQRAPLSIDNDGKLVVKNRRWRRAKGPTDNKFTKKQKTRTEIKKSRKMGRK